MFTFNFIPMLKYNIEPVAYFHCWRNTVIRKILFQCTDSHFWQNAGITIMNKKVLLHERKRHTARRVASTPYVVLTGYPPGQGTPLAGYPPRQGTPQQGTPPARVPPCLDLAGYPPPSCPMAFWKNVAKHYGIWVPPPGVDKLTKWNYYLPVVLRTRGGNNLFGKMGFNFEVLFPIIEQ